MEHQFIQGEKGQPVLVLLHGTGGSMNDLLPVAKQLNKQASILSLQGDVLENGQRRFFKRFPDASFDWEDLEKRGMNMKMFIKNASEIYHFSMEDVVLVGYSNGANIAINLLLEQGTPYKRAILFHPMYPLEELKENNKSELNVFVSFGIKDPIVSVVQSQHVIDLFEKRGAGLSQIWTTGHQLTYDEVEKATQWLNEL